MSVERCSWCGEDPLYVAYHDEEWGVPAHDEHHLFEMLSLEGAQAGLAWITILRKREGYRRAFEGFDPAKVARFSASRVDKLVADPGIVRHRGKIESVISNARAVADIQGELGSLDAYFWRFVDGEPIVGTWRSVAEIPASTPTSEALSKDLKKRGFRFVGPTTCYAFMQATGMVDDHVADCSWRVGARRS